MRMIAIDSSGETAGVALWEDGILRGLYDLNYKKTHSETLLPMLDQMLAMAGIRVEEAELIAVAAGPGSFTGLRIGVAMAKGLAAALSVPVLPVPTLEGLAYGGRHFAGVVCPMMDARRGQVYSGIYGFRDMRRTFDRKDGMDFPEATPRKVPESMGESSSCAVEGKDGEPDVLEILYPGDAMAMEEQLERLVRLTEPVLFCGDGIRVHEERIGQRLREEGIPFFFAGSSTRYQSAGRVAQRAQDILEAGGKPVSAAELAPDYMRRSQAERELAEKQLGPEGMGTKS